MSTWSDAELSLLDAADELQIAVRREDGSLRRWLPIWVVRVDGQAYVRTWHRRETGWFGQAVAIGRAAVRVPGLQADVLIDDVGAGPTELTAAVDDAYRAKYAGGAASMVTPDAVASTLRLSPE